MNAPVRAGSVVAAIGLLSVAGLSLSSGRLGSCGPSSPWVIVALLSAFICLPLAALFLIVGLPGTNGRAPVSFDRVPKVRRRTCW